MAVSVIDTRGELKLVKYSGDGEHWPQWVLKLGLERAGRLRTTTGCSSSVNSANREHNA